MPHPLPDPETDPRARAALAAVRALHDELDTWALELHARHRDRLQCGRGCTQCCTDELTVLQVEALRIVAGHRALLETGTPGPTGACAFLAEDGACRIYEDRPQVCRTQGLPLRWIAERAPGEWVEYRDICPLNEEGEPIETLDIAECWSLGVFEPRLADLQAELQGTADDPAAPLHRVALRDLFVPPRAP